jgi:hypothetical protein
MTRKLFGLLTFGAVLCFLGPASAAINIDSALREVFIAPRIPNPGTPPPDYVTDTANLIDGVPTGSTTAAGAFTSRTPDQPEQGTLASQDSGIFVDTLPDTLEALSVILTANAGVQGEFFEAESSLIVDFSSDNDLVYEFTDLNADAGLGQALVELVGPTGNVIYQNDGLGGETGFLTGVLQKNSQYRLLARTRVERDALGSSDPETISSELEFDFFAVERRDNGGGQLVPEPSMWFVWLVLGSLAAIFTSRRRQRQS